MRILADDPKTALLRVVNTQCAAAEIDDPAPLMTVNDIAGRVDRSIANWQAVVVRRTLDQLHFNRAELTRHCLSLVRKKTKVLGQSLPGEVAIPCQHESVAVYGERHRLLWVSRRSAQGCDVHDRMSIACDRDLEGAAVDANSMKTRGVADLWRSFQQQSGQRQNG